MQGKIPTTIVTGFLGAGKTTLLRHLLSHAGGRRIAVIVNEFGSLGVDAELLRGCGLGCDEEAGPGLYELANGCLCCTVQEEFFPVMRELVARRGQIDHILIETSGLALPKPLVQAFNWPEVRAACTVDAVVTVVDTPAVAAGRFAHDPDAVQAQRPADPELDHAPALADLFEDQLACADIVVLNKLGDVDPATAEAVRDIVRRHVPAEVALVDCVDGTLDAALVLGLNRAVETVIEQRGDDHDHDDHEHAPVDTVVLDVPETDAATLERAVRSVLGEGAILRLKGVVAVEGKPMRMIVQGVGRRLQQYYDRPWRADERRSGRLVVLGFGLDPAVLQARMDAALAVTA